MFDFISQAMLFLLQSLKHIVGDYGWAIIALTVLVRVVLWPVSRSQMQSMKMMQDLQPKMKMLQERHKAEPQKLQAEMMKLYKDHKFNPLGGCLPMLVQIPLFIGLYWAINNPTFLANGDPVFLHFIHLNHSGVVSHGGPSNNGVMTVDPHGGGFMGFGKDRLVAANKMTLMLKNGTIIDNKNVPNPSHVLTMLPKELQPGIPVKISTRFKDLDLDGYEDQVKTIELTVLNTGTKETEKITLTPGADGTLQTQLETIAGKTVFHADVLLLVIIFAVSMVMSQRAMTGQATAGGSPQQQQMMKMMPLMFSAFLFIFPIPAGVLLYMDTNSLFQLFQTWMFQRTDKNKVNGAPPSQNVLDVKPN